MVVDHLCFAMVEGFSSNVEEAFSECIHKTKFYTGGNAWHRDSIDCMCNNKDRIFTKEC